MFHAGLNPSFNDFEAFAKNSNEFKFLLRVSFMISHNDRAVDTGGASGAMAPPIFCKIILFVFSAKHSFSSSRVWILYINNWIHHILNDNKVIN